MAVATNLANVGAVVTANPSDASDQNLHVEADVSNAVVAANDPKFNGNIDVYALVGGQRLAMSYEYSQDTNSNPHFVLDTGLKAKGLTMQDLAAGKGVGIEVDDHTDNSIKIYNQFPGHDTPVLNLSQLSGSAVTDSSIKSPVVLQTADGDEPQDVSESSLADNATVSWRDDQFGDPGDLQFSVSLNVPGVTDYKGPLTYGAKSDILNALGIEVKSSFFQNNSTSPGEFKNVQVFPDEWNANNWKINYDLGESLYTNTAPVTGTYPMTLSSGGAPLGRWQLNWTK